MAQRQIGLRDALFYKDIHRILFQAIQQLRISLDATMATSMAFAVSLVTLSPDYNLKDSEKELVAVRRALMKLLDDGKPDFDDWVIGLEVSKESVFTT